MAATKRLPEKIVRVGSFTLGNQFSANKWFDVSFQNLPEYQLPGFKSIITEIELKCALTATTLANDQALPGMFLHYLLDTEVYGPGGARWRQRKGWHDPIWNAVQDGRVLGQRAAALPLTGGSPGSYARTFSKHIRFTEDLMSSRFAACPPSIAMAKGNGKLRFFLHNSSEGVRPGGAGPLGLGCSAAVIDVFVHTIDVPNTKVPLCVFLEEMSIDGLSDMWPSPDIGDYLRIVLANGPAFGATSWDDVSAYTNIDSFGVPGNFRVFDTPVDLWYREFHKQITDQFGDEHTLLDAAAANQKAEFRVLDPIENNDGKLRGIPLVYPRFGQDIAEAVRFRGAKPLLKTNGNSRAGLPATIDFLVHRVQPRDDKALNAMLTALSPNAVHRGVDIPMSYKDASGKKLPGIDERRIPLLVDAHD